MIIDILFAAGTIGFLSADLKQWHKLYKHQHPTKAISRTHLYLKIISLTCVISGYGLSALHILLVVASIQLLTTIGILRYTLKRYDL